MKDVGSGVYSRANLRTGIISRFLPSLSVLVFLVTATCVVAQTNPIVAENLKPGNSPDEWDIDGAGDTTIQGFATDISVNKGDTIHFKVKTNATNYRLDIYRLGYYQGLGARLVATVIPSASLPKPSPTRLPTLRQGW